MRRRGNYGQSHLQQLSEALERFDRIERQWQHEAEQRAQLEQRAQRMQAQKERVEMKLRDVSATEIAEVVKLVRSNPAAAAELTELIASGQVEVTTRSDGTLSVRAAEASDTVATSLTAPFKPGTGAIDSRTAYQEIAKIAASTEGKIALQKHRTGQGLTPNEAALIKRHDELMAANARQAESERPNLPGTYSTKPEFASKLVRELVAERDGFTRINDARQAIAELRARGDHPAFNEQSPNHKQGVEELHQLYQIAYPETSGDETK